MVPGHRIRNDSPRRTIPRKHRKTPSGIRHRIETPVRWARRGRTIMRRSCRRWVVVGIRLGMIWR